MGRFWGLRGMVRGVTLRHRQTCESLASWESLLLCAPCSPPWLLQSRQQCSDRQ